MTTYTNFLKLRAQDYDQQNWDVLMNENLAIIDFMSGALNSANWVVSGGAVTIGTGLNADIPTLNIEVGGRGYTVSAASVACTASSLNYIYVNGSGTVVSATAAPTGDYVPLAVVDAGATALLRIGDLRRIAPHRMIENDCINGTFQIWQRADSQTSSGYGSDDRWINLHNGSTKTHSKQLFSVGQTDVPGGPEYYSSTVVSSVAGAANYVRKTHRISDVRKYSGKRVCVKFHAKADAAKSIAIEGRQNFGTGGSATIDKISPQTIALTATWQKFVVFIDFPSISTKTVGDLSFSQFDIWFDAGTDFNANTNTLGQQSGTFDISEVEVYVSDRELPVRRRTAEEERQQCLPYCYKLGPFANSAAAFNMIGRSSSLVSGVFRFPAPMMRAPDFSYTGTFQLLGVGGEVLSSLAASYIQSDSMLIDWNDAGSPFVTRESHILALDAGATMTFHAEI